MGKYPKKKIRKVHDNEVIHLWKGDRHFKTILHLPGYNEVQNNAKNNQHRSISSQHQLTSVKSESCNWHSRRNKKKYFAHQPFLAFFSALDFSLSAISFFLSIGGLDCKTCCSDKISCFVAALSSNLFLLLFFIVGRSFNTTTKQFLMNTLDFITTARCNNSMNVEEIVKRVEILYRNKANLRTPNSALTTVCF